MFPQDFYRLFTRLGTIDILAFPNSDVGFLVDEWLQTVTARLGDDPDVVMQIFKFAAWRAMYRFGHFFAMEISFPPTHQSRRNYGRFSVIMVEAALSVADSKFLTALLNYCVCDIARCLSDVEFTLALIIVRDFREEVLTQADNSYNWSLELIDLLKFDGYIVDSTMRGCRRILCIIKVLSVLQVKRSWQPSGVLEAHVQCFRMYFRAIPEPFISRKDVEGFLRFLFRSGVSEDLIESLGRDYESLFQYESSTTYTPRSLKHLSRLCIRKSLQWKATTLPNAVRSLSISAPLMDFLMCNE